MEDLERKIRKEVIAELASFIKTGTVVANGDIGSVTMYLPKEYIGTTVYLYDHGTKEKLGNHSES